MGERRSPWEVRTSRREVLATAAVAGTAALAGPTAVAAARRHRRPTVAVYGGGVAGLTAAHELALRGCAVTVYERRVWGGKCFSSRVPETATGGREPLPGEHAYRVPFGFYRNLPETMRSIPFGTNPQGVFGNLVAAPQLSFARKDKRDLVLPMGSLDPRPYTPQQVVDLIRGVAVEMQLPPAAAARFAQRVAVFLSSCAERRSGQWDATSWLDFIEADRHGEDYRKTLGSLPEFTQASKAQDTSAKYIGTLLELALYGLLGRGSNGPVIRVLDGPTQDAWITPWLAELRRLGVRFRRGWELRRVGLEAGRPVAVVRDPRGRRRRISAEHHVCALPVERARALLGPAVRRAAPELAGMDRLGVAWMNGVSYFLRRRFDAPRGHVLMGDSPWGGSFVCQAQFWQGDFAARYGDGTVHEKLSAAITDWDAPGVRFGRPARRLSPDEVALDLWEQIKQHVNEPGTAPTLTDEMLHSWEVDPLMPRRGGRLDNEDPLVLPSVGTEQHRPPVRTSIPGLLLAGDYLSRDWIITTMESACHTGRLAARAVVEDVRPRETPVTVLAPFLPEEWAPLRDADRAAWSAGRPNLFDTP